MKQESLFVLIGDEDQVLHSWGSDAADALQAHFDGLDVYCSPPDDMDTDASTFRAYRVPADAEERVLDLLEEIEGHDEDARAAAVGAHLNSIDGVVEVALSAQYRQGELLIVPAS